MASSLLERVLAVPQVPHLHRRVAVIIKSHKKLRGNLRVPSYTGATRPACRVLETDDLFLLLQVPDHCGAVIGA